MAKKYDFKYKVYWKNGDITEGSTEGSKLHPAELLLENNFTCFNNNSCVYFNKDEIRNIEITNYIERDDNNV